MGGGRSLLTYHVDGVRADHVLRELGVGSVADDDDAAALAINAECHVRAGDPAAVRRRLRPRGVALEIMAVHRPLYVRGRIRVLRRASDEHLVVRLRLGRPDDGHPGGRDCVVKKLKSVHRLTLSHDENAQFIRTVRSSGC